MMRAVAFVAAAALAAADFASFNPTISVYSGGANCTQLLGSLEGTTNGCAQIGNTIYYAKSAGCNFDDSVSGFQVCTSATCSANTCVDVDMLAQASNVLPFGCLSTPNGFAVNAQCIATPCCQTTGIIVSFAVILALMTVGLCVLWVRKDYLFKIKAKHDQEALERSIASEKAKAEQVTGFSFGTTGTAAAGTAAVHGGYSAL